MSAPAQLFGSVYAALEAELDWERLGRTYCEGDGSSFFDAKLRSRMLDTGLLIADDLARRLAANGPRRSVYLGAAVAELCPILVEQLVLGREVIWLNLDSIEARELARAIAAVEAGLGTQLPRPSCGAPGDVAPGSCDHLWLVSVFTDPDAFPALHDELYARAGSAMATGRGSVGDDRLRADKIARELLDCATSPCALSTTEEELEILRPLAKQLGWSLDVFPTFRTSAVVGDRIRSCRLVR